MIVINERQGSDAWLQIRSHCFTASEAPAMMGCSPYMTRTQLLDMKKTGVVEEVDGYKQKLFDKGHEAEAAARPLVEAMIGEELYPVTGREGDLLASFDGLTIDHRIGFEHKLLNDKLVKQIEAKDLEPMYAYQLEQQLLVSGAEKIIFVCSDGTAENFHSMEYVSQPERREALIDGWSQFEKDLADHVPAESAPKVEAAAIDSLPALFVDLAGEVKSSNLATFKDAVTGRIAAINTDLKTDQDFADAEATVKFLAGGEKDLESAKRAALAQTATIEELFRTIDDLRESMRAKRLELDKLVKEKKKTVRYDIAKEHKDLFDAHVAGLADLLPDGYRLPPIATDFGNAMKGKRTLDSCRSACSDELARAKIEANRVRDGILSNARALEEIKPEYNALFPDKAALALKSEDDLLATIKARVLEHEAAVQKAAEEKAAQATAAPAAPDQPAREEVAKVAAAESDAERVNEALHFSTGTPSRKSIIRLVGDAYNLSDSQAERAIVAAFAREAA